MRFSKSSAAPTRLVCARLAVLIPGGIADGARGGNTSLSDADVMVKLNKRDGRPVWTFEISGRVSVPQFYS